MRFAPGNIRRFIAPDLYVVVEVLVILKSGSFNMMQEISRSEMAKLRDKDPTQIGVPQVYSVSRDSYITIWPTPDISYEVKLRYTSLHEV